MSDMRVKVTVDDCCKPSECAQECKKFCPVERMGKTCINVNHYSVKARVFSDACINCDICTKKCPKKAISVEIHENQ